MRWLARRSLSAVATLLVVLTLVFGAIHLAPGTPFMPRGDRPPLDAAAVARLQARFGLDQPIAVQYGRYIGALVRGELGESFSARRPVAAMIADAIPNTLLLAAAALAIEFLLGLGISIYQGIHAGSHRDRALTNLTLFIYSLPTFWLGLVLLLVFGERLHWLPVGGITDPAIHDSLSIAGRAVDRIRHLILPAVTLGLIGAAGTARFERPAVIAALHDDYIRSARARGVGSRRILWAHAVRNALLPYITLAGLAFPFLLTGAVVVESVFAWPGMGKLAADAIATRDYPVVMAATLLAAVMVIVGNLAADCCYAVADPRIREASR
ncbi:MAG TPA: ABC transporter permease [Gemmatimonadales bacterium]